MYKIPRVGLVMKIISRGRRKWNLEFQSPQILGKGIWNFSCVILHHFFESACDVTCDMFQRMTSVDVFDQSTLSARFSKQHVGSHMQNWMTPLSRQRNRRKTHQKRQEELCPRPQSQRKHSPKLKFSLFEVKK